MSVIHSICKKFELLNQLSDKYPSDAGYVFKSCSINWIVVLKKLQDTKTNESRYNVKNSMYAKFRANKLLVVDIMHKFNDESIGKITNCSYEDKTITYKKCKTVEVSDFDENINNICTPGIHYFKSPEAAFYYELINVENGICKKWYENGQLHSEGTFKGNKLNGSCKNWYRNGKLQEECTYKNGKLDGLYRQWYSNGQLKEECTYKDNNMYGLCKSGMKMA
jgi:antitoxin component YwqK of YwqJK toxin-antitoxin module